MRNNNQKVIRRLSSRSMKNSRMRNGFAVIAVALTCMMFTVLASMGIGMMQVAQEQTMREVGGKFHAGLKKATQEQMERVTADERVVSYTWNILIGTAENVIQRSAEIRFPQGEQELENSFIELEEGSLPQKENEILVDTIVMDELGVPHETGAQIPLEFTFFGETIRKTFTVSGWYEGDQISHASQLYVSEAYWEELKGARTDEDFLRWGEEHPDQESVGLYSVGLYFRNDKKIEDTVISIIEDAGYEPGTELEYGVNWAYMGSRTESLDAGSAALLLAALVVILLSGYLIIFNIFQISVVNDIRFYGLLKTIGTTKRQLKRLIRRQALILSAAGIPLGLAAGYLISCVMFPFAMSFLNLGGMKVSLHFDVRIILFGAAFSLLTVLISCRRPAKIAGSVSPVEAVRYSEGNVKRKKQKKSERGAKVHRMALSNLGRNKKKTVFVLLSLSLSVSLFCVVLTAVGSFRIDSYLSQRLIGDVTVGTVNYTSGYNPSAGFVVDDELIARLDEQPGIQSRQEMWTASQTRVRMDDAALARFLEYREQGKLREDDSNWTFELDYAIENRSLDTSVYGYDTDLLQNLTVLSGTFDAEKFEQGGYILLSVIVGDHTEDCLVYEPGEKVTVQTPDPDAELQEIKNEQGEIVGYEYTDFVEKEYEVMAIVDIPYSMDEHTYPVNGVEAVLPKQEIAGSGTDGYRFAVSYTLEDEAEEAFVETVEQYTEQVNPYMSCVTKESLMEEFRGMTGVIQTIGVALCIVVAVIGVMNFVNSVLTGIIARKRELAIMNSIGMTRRQIRQMLVEEGLYYVAISGIISIAAGSLLSYGILHALNQVILFFEYRYNGLAFVILLPLFALVAVIAPAAAYGKTGKESVVEKLRDTEN